MSLKDINRFYNSEYHHPTIRTGPGVSPHDHLAFNQALAPDVHLTKPTATGRRHYKHEAVAARTHICTGTNQMTYRTSQDMYMPQVQEGKAPWGNESPSRNAAISHDVSAACLPGEVSAEATRVQREPDTSRRDSTRLGCVKQALQDVSTENKTRAAPELAGRQPEEGLRLLRAALSKRGVHGGLEFTTQLRNEATPTSEGPVIGFTDFARITFRFCTMPDGYLHAIFRLLDKDCYGCVRVSNVVDIALANLTVAQMNKVKILYAALHERLLGDMDIRKVLQLEQFKNHVDHLSGRKSKATLISEFADCLASDSVNWAAFHFYYRAVATCTMENVSSFHHMVHDIWQVVLPSDEAAAVLRAQEVTEPSMTYVAKAGSLRRYAQHLHIGASPIFNPATFEQPVAKPQGRANGIMGHKMHSSVVLG